MQKDPKHILELPWMETHISSVLLKLLIFGAFLAKYEFNQ